MNTTLSAIATLVLALAGQPAHAQVSASTSQSGSNNSASTHQRGPTELLAATIAQDGTGNRAGDPAGGGIEQLDNDVGARAIIVQRGENNDAGIGQIKSYLVDALVRQDGSGNQARIEQHNAWRSQAAADQGGTGNHARIVQEDVGDVSVGVIQRGTGNQAEVAQVRTGFDGTRVEQNGSANSAQVSQTGAIYQSTEVTQTGSMNAIDVAQTEGTIVRIGATQEGAGNRATLAQSGEASDIVLTQQGNGNQAGITQRMFGNDAEVTQLHDRNAATIVQEGSARMPQSRTAVSIYQDGNDNGARVHQRAGERSLVVIEQIGNRNRAESDQHQPGAESLYASMLQIGDDNAAAATFGEVGREAGLALRQFGDGNRTTLAQGEGFVGFATVDQSGLRNRADVRQMGGVATQVGFVFQTGVDNVASISQRNGLLRAVITQTGTQHEASIIQHGGQGSGEIEQEGSLNVASIRQSAPAGSAYNDAAISQFGTGLSGEIVQNGGGNRAALVQR